MDLSLDVAHELPVTFRVAKVLQIVVGVRLVSIGWSIVSWGHRRGRWRWVIIRGTWRRRRDPSVIIVEIGLGSSRIRGWIHVIAWIILWLLARDLLEWLWVLNVVIIIGIRTFCPSSIVVAIVVLHFGSHDGSPIGLPNCYINGSLPSVWEVQDPGSLYDALKDYPLPSCDWSWLILSDQFAFLPGWP